MDRHQETTNTWNKIAGLYEQKFMHLDLYNESYQAILASIKTPNAKLLDVGCGPGNVTKYLLGKQPDLDILGIDTAPAMIERARQNNPAARFAVMDCRRVHTLSERYDGIVVGFCLPYLTPSESELLIENAYALLNDHGIIYLSFVEGDPAASGFQSNAHGRIYFNYHRLNDLEFCLEQTGFSELRLFKVNYGASDSEPVIHSILIATKSVGIIDENGDPAKHNG